MEDLYFRNCGFVLGRLQQDPVRLGNEDGSRKYQIFLAVPRNNRSQTGAREVDVLDLEAYVPGSELGRRSIYDLLRKEDLVAICYTVRVSVYTNAAGRTYRSKVLFIQDLELMESRSVTDERMTNGLGPAWENMTEAERAELLEDRDLYCQFMAENGGADWRDGGADEESSELPE